MEQGTGTVDDAIECGLELWSAGRDAEARWQVLQNFENMRRGVGEAPGVGHGNLQRGVVQLGVGLCKQEGEMMQQREDSSYNHMYQHLLEFDLIESTYRDLEHSKRAQRT